MYKVGSARIGENGKATGGKRGDQTGQEVTVQPAYMHKNGWIGYRAKDANIANALAWLMMIACASNEVGYNQNERYLIFWTNIQKNVPTNADCSTLVPWCVRQAGINIDINGIWTGNLGERLLATGAFEKVAINSISDMCTGDILVDSKGTSHTVIVTEGRDRLSGNYFDEPEPILYPGNENEEVIKLQKFFNQFCGTDLRPDGVFGDKTKFALVCFQTAWRLTADGIYGAKSHEAVCFVLWCNNTRAV